MARSFVLPNVGARGRRRIVPMMGIDFIAGQIERKGGPIPQRAASSSTVVKPYGQKPPSIGGRTRSWSFINFLNVESNMGRSSAPTAAEVGNRTNFTNATLSALATSENLQVLSRVLADFQAGTVYNSISPNDYATPRGWLTAIRMDQIASGVNVTPTYTVWPPVYD